MTTPPEKCRVFVCLLNCTQLYNPVLIYYFSMLSGPWFAGQEGGNDEKRLGIQTLESKRKEIVNMTEKR